MEVFFNDIALEKVVAMLFIAALLFNSFFREDFMINKKEKEHLKKIGNKINNRLSGKTVMAIFYFTLILISACIAILFYKK